MAANKVAGLPPQAPPSFDNNSLKSKKYREAMEEFNKINQAMAAITEAENKIKREQMRELQNNQENINTSSNIVHSDQSKVPAAMRTSIMFGVC
jgi:hypothetical protein